MTLELRTLVLNADCRPVTRYPLSTWPFERTLRNVLKDRVNVLEHYDVTLASQSFSYRVPSVVQLRHYVKKPARVAFTRMNIFLRDGFTCQYCHEKFEAKDLTFDHVLPRSKGGKDSFENICSACVPCNAKKGNDERIRPAVMPREPTPEEMLHLRQLQSETFHKSWMDYLYWSGALERD